MNTVKITDPVTTLSDAVRVIKSTAGRLQSALEAETAAREAAFGIKVAMQQALEDDDVAAISGLNGKYRQANNAIDRAIDRHNAIKSEYSQAIALAERAMCVLRDEVA